VIAVVYDAAHIPQARSARHARAIAFGVNRAARCGSDAIIIGRYENGSKNVHSVGEKKQHRHA